MRPLAREASEQTRSANTAEDIPVRVTGKVDVTEVVVYYLKRLPVGFLPVLGAFVATLYFEPEGMLAWLAIGINGVLAWWGLRYATADKPTRPEHPAEVCPGCLGAMVGISAFFSNLLALAMGYYEFAPAAHRLPIAGALVALGGLMLALVGLHVFNHALHQRTKARGPAGVIGFLVVFVGSNAFFLASLLLF